MKKKVLSILLAVCMALTLLPTKALASNASIVNRELPLYNVSYNAGTLVNNITLLEPQVSGTDNAPVLTFQRSTSEGSGGVITSNYTMDFTRSFNIEGTVNFAERDGVSFALHTTPKKASYLTGYNTCMFAPEILHKWARTSPSLTLDHTQIDMTNGLLWDFMQFKNPEVASGTRFWAGAYSYQIKPDGEDTTLTALACKEADDGILHADAVNDSGAFNLSWQCADAATATGTLTLTMGGNTTFTYTALNASEVFGTLEKAKAVYFSFSTFLPSVVKDETETETKIAIDKAYYTDTGDENGSTLGVETAYYIDTDNDGNFETQLKKSTLVGPDQTILVRNKIYNKNKNAQSPMDMTLLIPNLSKQTDTEESQINRITDEAFYIHDHDSGEEVLSPGGVKIQGNGPLNSANQLKDYATVRLPAGGDGTDAFDDAYSVYEYRFVPGDKVLNLNQTIQLGVAPFTPAVVHSTVTFNSPEAFKPDNAAGKLYFGDQNGLYRVMAKDKNSITLFYHKADATDGGLGQSAGLSWLNNGFYNSLTAQEQAALLPYQNGGSTKIVLPSENEICEGGTWGMDDTARATAVDAEGSTNWWLRDTGRAVTGNGTSIVDLADGGRYGIRPALRLNLANVLFVTDSTGKVDTAVDAALESIVAAAEAAPYRMTLLDSTSSFAVTENGSIQEVSANDRITLHYTGATSGAGCYVSALFSDATGQNLYYGRLAEITDGDDTSGTVTVNVPPITDNGVYTLKVFSETIYDGASTDVASQFQTVTCNVGNNLNGTVFVNGTPEYGCTLTAQVAHSNYLGSLQYLWKHTDGTTLGTGSTYLITDADIGKTITCTVKDSGVTKPRDNAIVSLGVAIGKRPLTVAAENKQISQGAALPEFTLTYSGFVNGDTQDTVFAAAPTATVAADVDGKKAGTFPITVTAELTPGMEDLYTLTTTNGTLTVQALSSGGAGPISTPVPVTGSGTTVKTDVTISGNTVTVKEPSKADLEKVLAAAATDKKNLEIDLSSLSRNLTNVKLPANTLAAASQSAAAGGVTGLTVKLPNGNTVTFDSAALSAVSGIAGGQDLILSIDQRSGAKPSDTESALLGGKSVTSIFDLTLKDGTGKVVSDFSGGTATVVLGGVKMTGNLSDYALFHKIGDELVAQPFTAVATNTAGEYDLTMATPGWSSYLLTYAENRTPFTDVAGGDYFYDAVLWAMDQGITAGSSQTTFAPHATCTRAQAVTFLWRAMGSPQPTAKSCPFTDVAPDAYYYKAVLWATEQGITAGTSPTTFSPHRTVTRSQTVTFLWRTDGKPAATGANPFADVANDAYYVDAVQWAVAKNIAQGTDKTAFGPLSPCSRAQMVTFLYRYLGK